MDYNKINSLINNDHEPVKLKKSLNVSIHKRHVYEISKILKTWDDEGFVTSTEVCESILFKNTMQNNPYLHILFSTIKLIESNLKNKELFNLNYEKALTLALKNILTVDINTENLKKFMEDENYFLNPEETPVKTIPENPIHQEPAPTEEKNFDENELAYTSTPNHNYKRTIENDKKSKTTDSIIKWNIPEEPSISPTNEDINKKFEAFQYGSF